jgi:50S ribosomal protein L16 3-hydroxylase
MSGFNLPDAMTAEDFLSRYWQRAPLLCPRALDAGALAIDPDDLLDIACEAQADARLVMRQGQVWRVEQGPFAPSYADDLPDRAWSLLLQSMEVWWPELHGLIDALGFLPRWRVDDVMISLSAAGGGVGPHVDQYDVFLVQAAGRRCWAYGGPVSDLVPDRPLRLLSDFRPEEQHILEPGDVLYLPPGVPHDGVALDDGCATISIGFRAPGVSDLASKFADQLLTRWQDDVEHEPRFRDPGRAPAGDPAQIEIGDAKALADMISASLADPGQAMRLAGELMTEPRMPPDPPEHGVTADEIMAHLSKGGSLERWSGSRLAYGPASDGRAYLFADGGSLLCSPELAEAFAAATAIDRDHIAPFADDPELKPVLIWLTGQGTFGLAED